MSTSAGPSRHERPLRNQIRPHANDPSPDRRLRIGYVSPDFREHPVGHFMEPLIRGHNRTNVDIFCYSNALRSDAITRQIKAAADHCARSPASVTRASLRSFATTGSTS